MKQNTPAHRGPVCVWAGSVMCSSQWERSESPADRGSGLIGSLVAEQRGRTDGPTPAPLSAPETCDRTRPHSAAAAALSRWLDSAVCVSVKQQEALQDAMSRSTRIVSSVKNWRTGSDFPPNCEAAEQKEQSSAASAATDQPERLSRPQESGLMSLSVSYPCGRVGLVCGLLLLASSPLLIAGRLTNCTHPLVPEHGGFRCDPSPCRGFPQKSSIHLFCEPGYHINSKVRVTRCRHGRWQPPIPACIPVKGPNMNSDDRASDSMPSMATMAVGVSIFLLTTTACLVVKSRLYPCQSHR
ncbi:hypothetical protein L3Q82_004821 [Scortum barcoo]|uniref:Uncharacterized protein n=1 Tax=Scortum barcoo TaxID=214431 RepID=A0ACB8VDC2_9TELE|nr:hypothetical protein L3Q82_004821 [Scortum barcoo]